MSRKIYFVGVFPLIVAVLTALAVVCANPHTPVHDLLIVGGAMWIVSFISGIVSHNRTETEMRNMARILNTNYANLFSHESLEKVGWESLAESTKRQLIDALHNLCVLHPAIWGRQLYDLVDRSERFRALIKGYEAEFVAMAVQFSVPPTMKASGVWGEGSPPVSFLSEVYKLGQKRDFNPAANEVLEVLANRQSAFEAAQNDWLLCAQKVLERYLEAPDEVGRKNALQKLIATADNSISNCLRIIEQCDQSSPHVKTMKELPLKELEFWVDTVLPKLKPDLAHSVLEQNNFFSAKGKEVLLGILKPAGKPTH